jgi:low affinity Fe/Cu permease
MIMQVEPHAASLHAAASHWGACAPPPSACFGTAQARGTSHAMAGGMHAKLPSARRRARRDIHGEHLERARSTSGGPFRRFSRAASSAVGRPWAFVSAVVIVLSWAMLGPLFHYSDTWQLVINTGTTIITFLMVFLIQNTQNRDTEALRLKLDELILATEAARNEFVDIDDLDDEQLEHLEQELRRLAASRGMGDVVRLSPSPNSEAKH